MPSVGDPLAMRLPRHVGVVARDLRRAMDALGHALALSWSDPTEATQRLRDAGGISEWNVSLVHSTAGPMRVELLAGPPGSPWHTTDLARLHHYAYTTDDIVDDCARFGADGWEIEVTIAHESGGPHGFAYLVRPSRPRIELIQIARTDQPAMA